MRQNEVEIEEIAFKEIDSTQVYARKEGENLMKKKKGWYVIRADSQTAGVGQGDHKWFSPPDVNIYATFILPWEDKHSELIPYLTQTPAVAVCQVLEDFDFKPKIKWENDILLDDKKVSGILTEVEEQWDGKIILIGIGINVNMESADCESVDQPVTSLKLERDNRHLDKIEVFNRLKDKLFDCIESLKKGKFSNILQYIKKHTAYQGCVVKITDSDEPGDVIGIFQGLNDDGQLILEVEGTTKVLLRGRMTLCYQELVDV